MIVFEILASVIEWVYTVVSFSWAWVTNKPYWHGVLLAGLLASSCGVITAQNAADLSPEQIKELRDQGHVVIKCFQIGGPPPAGNTTIIIVPRGSISKFKFSANCAILEGSLETK